MKRITNEQKIDKAMKATYPLFDKDGYITKRGRAVLRNHLKTIEKVLKDTIFKDDFAERDGFMGGAFVDAIREMREHYL